MKSAAKLMRKVLSLALSASLTLAMAVTAAPAVPAQAAAGDAPATEKQLIENGDGTYTLALSVTGATESSSTTQVTKANVILVVDTSNSMNSNSGTPNVSRIQAEKDALTKTNGIIDNLLSQNVAGDPVKSDIIEVAVANFGTRGTTAQTFTTNGTTLKNTINGLTTSTGTNWEEGLMRAQELAADINASQPNEQIYIIFLTDGEPTTHNGSYSVNTDYASEWGQANDNARAIVTAGYEFYGLFTWGNGNRSHFLSSLVQYAYTGSGNSNSSLDPAYAQYFTDASDTETLIEALNQIVHDITTGVGYTNVELEDGVTSMTTSNIKTTASGEITNMKYYRSGGPYSTTANNGLGEEWTGAPHATVNEGGEVDWALGDTVLENGVTYTMTFVVWPSQESIDLVADLNNGLLSYDNLPADQKSQISVSNGHYKLKTNTDYPKVTYSTITTTTVDGETTTVVSDPITTTITNPDPVGIAEEKLHAIKKWEDELDPSQREEIEEVELYLLVDGDYYFVDEDGHPLGVKLTEASNWTETDYVAIAPGIMVTADSPAYDPDAPHVTWGGATYAIIEPGHEYVFEESEINYHYELTAYTHHPMIMGTNADGTPHIVDVTFTKDASGNITGIESVAEMGDNLSATNTLKGGINITKKVVDENGEEVEDLNPFAVTVTVTDPEGAALPEKTAADGTSFTIDYRIYYGPNNPNYDEASGGGRSDHIYVSGTSFEETIYVGDTLRVVNVEDGSLYTVEETVPTGYDPEYTVDYTINYAGEDPAAFPEGEDPSVQGNSISYAEITNTYTFGSLQVSKTVEVESGDEEQAKAKEFEFTFNLYEDDTKATLLQGNKYNYTKTAVDGTTSTDTITVGDTFKLKDGESIVIDKLPDTAYYEVVETAVTGYDTEATGDTGTIVANETAEAAFTNTYSVEPMVVDPPVKKDITGTEELYNKGDFTFVIANTAAPEGVTAPMPENTEITNSVDYELANKKGYYEFGEIEFTAPGTYTYTVTESGSVVGVTNDADATKNITFTVTDKGDGTMTVTPGTDSAVFSFTNEYKTGELDITKTVVNGSTTKEFTFTVNLKDADGKALEGEFPYIVYENGEATETTGTISSGGTLTLTDGQTAKITDIPDGAAYEVTEAEASGYTTTKSGDTGTIDDGTVAAAVFTNTYAAEGEAILEATKAIEGAGWPENGTITFTLSGEGGTLPETRTVNLQAAGKATFGAIAYDESDAGKTYTYTISEDGFGDGWTGSGDVTAKVTVSDNGDGTLATTVTYSPESDTITNTYVAEGTAVLEATKAIEGAGWPENGTITFTLSGEGGTLPETRTVTLTAPGKATFGAITYDESDAGETFTYTISEDGFGDGWTGSGSITATVAVTDNGDGTLGTTVTYSPENDTITNTYVAEGTAVLQAVKVIEGAAWPENGTITFTLSGEGGTLPETKTVTLQAAGKATFGAITYDESDVGKTYSYTISEDGFGDGWTGSDSITATVAVTDNGNGTLKTEVTYSPEDAVITNTYKAEGEIELFAGKKLDAAEGLNAPDVTGKYTLTLEAQNGAPMPEGAADGKVEVKNTDGSGTMASFGKIVFNEADAGKSYTYKVTESGTVDGVTNGTSEYTVTVTVTDKGDGTLTATASPSANTLFINTYEVSPIEISFPVQKVMEVPTGMSGPESWSYDITVEAQNGAPAAETMTGKVTKAADTVNFGDFTYTAPGTYVYKVTETGEVKGVTNDSAAESGKTVTVTVTDNGDGTLSATATSTTDAPLTFTNTYGASGSTTTALLQKKVDAFGSAWATDNGKTFTFAIEGKDGAPLGKAEDGSDVTTGTATFSAAGTQPVDFGTFTYDAPGTYKYTITETSTGRNDGWTYDNTPKEAIVTVTDNGDGTLIAEVTQVEIVNTYNADGEITLTGTKQLYGSDEPVTLEEDTAIKATVESDGAVTAEPLRIALTAADEETQLSIDSEDIVIAEGGDIAETEGIIEEDAQQTVLFGAITFKKTGVYTFAATQIVEEEQEGWTYDTEEKLITVEVTPGDGQLEATVTDNDPLFVNTYVDPNELAEVIFEIPAEIITKIEEDVEPVSQAFTLQIASEDEDVVIDTPEITSEEIIAGESGQVVFAVTAKVPVNAEELPVYSFTVSQSEEEIEGWTLNVENEAVQTVEVRINKIETEAEETEDTEATFEAVVEGTPVFVNAYAPAAEEELAEVSFQIPAEIITKIDEDIEAVSQAFTLYIASEDEGVEIGTTEITTEEILAGESANVAFDVTVQVPADAEELPVYSFTVAQVDQEIEGWTLNVENDSEQTVTVRINRTEVAAEDAETGEAAEKAEATVTYEAVVEGTPVFVNAYSPAAEDEDAITDETETDAPEDTDTETDAETDKSEEEPAEGSEEAAEGEAAAEPAAEVPAVKQSAEEVPATDVPAVTDPASDETVTEAPAVETPATEAPAMETPAAEPAVEVSVEAAPAAETPAAEVPAETPVTETSADVQAVEVPVEDAPVVEEPAAESPSLEAQPVEEPAEVEAVDGAAALWTTGYTNKVYLEGTEELVARALKGGEFTFEVYYGDTKVASGTNGAAEAGEKADITFSAIKFGTVEKDEYGYINVVETDESGNRNLKGEITLTVKETATSMSSIQENTQTFTVTLTITDNGDGTLSVSPAKEVEIAFVNYYITDVAKVAVSGTKDMVGRPLAADEYTFTIAVSPEDGPLPEVTSVKNDANGGFDFGEITFGQADLGADGTAEYTYTITESGEYPGVTNDPNNPKSFKVELSIEKQETGNDKIIAKTTGLEEGIKFINTYESEPVKTKVTTDIPVSKKLTGRELKEGEFTFELKDANGKVVSTASNDADGKVEFGELTFDKVGTYTYTISEVSGTLGGVTYDGNTYDATANVTEKLDENGKYTGQLECKWTNSGGLKEIEFINTYVPTPVKVGFNVKKTLTGRELKAGEFTFQMTDSDGNVETATNAADGTITFPEKTFKAAGTYTFTVTEVNDGKGGITYDADQESITVVVTDDQNGNLSATVTPASVTFENTYAPKGTAAAITARKVMLGRELQDQEFSFILRDSNGNVVAEAKNDAAGNVSFGTLNFDKAGEYNYTIIERTDTGLNVIYDTSTKNVTVKVVDNGDGTMTATVTGNGQTFTNEIGGREEVPPDDPPTPPTPPTPPAPTIVPPTPVTPQVLGAQRGVLGAQRGVLGAARTGDDKYMMTWLGVMLAGIAALVGYILFMLKRKKNKAA